MARYRKISTLIWNDAKFSGLSDDAQLLFFLLLTHPHMTSLGAMRTTIDGLAAEKKWKRERVSKGLFELSKKGMVRVDEKCCCVVLPNFLKHNPPENPNVVKSWNAAFEYVPECSLKVELFQYVAEYAETLPEPFRKAFETLPEPFRIQEQEQEQEQDIYMSENGPDPKRRKVAKLRTDYSAGFLSWWDSYPHDRRVSKPECFSVWVEFQLEDRTGELIEKLERLKQTTWKECERKHIKTTLPYLNSGRFEDDLIDLQPQRRDERRVVL